MKNGAIEYRSAADHDRVAVGALRANAAAPMVAPAPAGCRRHRLASFTEAFSGEGARHASTPPPGRISAISGSAWTARLAGRRQANASANEAAITPLEKSRS